VIAHFVGNIAYKKLLNKIKEQSAEINVLGLLGKQLNIKSAKIKVVQKYARKLGQREAKVVPKIRMMISDFEFMDSFWSV